MFKAKTQISLVTTISINSVILSSNFILNWLGQFFYPTACANYLLLEWLTWKNGIEQVNYFNFHLPLWITLYIFLIDLWLFTVCFFSVNLNALIILGNINQQLNSTLFHQSVFLILPWFMPLKFFLCQLSGIEVLSLSWTLSETMCCC